MKKIKLSNLTFMLVFICVLFSVATFHSCQNDISEIQSDVQSFSSTKEVSVNIKAADDWFNANKKNYITGNYILNLSKAIEVDNYVEVPYSIDNQLFKVPVTYDKGIRIAGRSKIIIFKEGNSFDLYIVNYYPTAKFIGNIKDINYQNLTSKKFDGNVVLENNIKRIIYNINNGVLTRSLVMNINNRLNTISTRSSCNPGETSSPSPDCEDQYCSETYTWNTATGEHKVQICCSPCSPTPENGGFEPGPGCSGCGSPPPPPVTCPGCPPPPPPVTCPGCPPPPPPPIE